MRSEGTVSVQQFKEVSQRLAACPGNHERYGDSCGSILMYIRKLRSVYNLPTTVLLDDSHQQHRLFSSYG